MRLFNNYHFFFSFCCDSKSAMSSKKVTNDGASSSKGSRNTAPTAETTNDPTNDPNAGDDKLFEPTLDMMVNDYDDESTLELEERMASTEAQDPNAELNSLQRVRFIVHTIFFETNFFIFLFLSFDRRVICQLRNY